MGLLDIFRKDKNKTDKANENQTTNETIKKKPFVSDISLYEFENADWTNFGCILKKNRILPNSYIKEPTSVDVKVSKKGQPMVLLTFHSATSDSIREFLLLQDKVFQSVNGAIDDGKNQDLMDVWNKFKNQIKLSTKFQTECESYKNKRKAKKMIEDANKMLGYDDFYGLEQNFLEQYKDVKFDDFTWSSWHMSGQKIPTFIPLLKEPVNGSFSGESVIPFSPRTLEYCILHMTNGEKAHHGEYVDDFEKMCRKIQEFSCFESSDWDKVIEIGKKLVKQSYQVSILENKKE